jgi:DNA-binding transcriptional regulator YhcF (GntR family)
MMDDYGVLGLASLAELNYMRLEAMDLFERCLTEGKTDSLEAFIEQQISQDPPRLELLREVAEDLHQRLLTLEENYADVLDRVWRALRDDFGVEIGTLDDLPKVYQQLEQKNIVQRLRKHNPLLTDSDEVMLGKMLDASVQTASQLHADVIMTVHLHQYVTDWVDGLSATIARRVWVNGRGDKYSGGLH